MLKYLLTLNALQLLRAYEIPLIGKSATQSVTWGNHAANLAIDGNGLTYSVTASQGNSNALGWWEVDLGGSYKVRKVVITASHDDAILHDFEIWFLGEDRSEKLCFNYSSSEPLPRGTTTAFDCKPDVLKTKYIRIRRTANSYRPDALALAEVRAYTASICKGGPIDPVIGGREIPLAGFQTAQSKTWGNYVSSLATDNSDSTFSIGCTICDGSLKAGVGWWQIDLKRDRNVTGIKITTSPDRYNAQFLKDFEVALSHVNTTDMTKTSRCHDYKSLEEGEMGVLKTLSIKCYQPTVGRYLIVRRKEVSHFRPDAIAIADIKIFEL